jgi:hypothetical protein
LDGKILFLFIGINKQQKHSRDEERRAQNPAVTSEKHEISPIKKSQKAKLSALSRISPTHLELFESPHIHESITVQIHSLTRTQSIIIARRDREKTRSQRDER